MHFHEQVWEVVKLIPKGKVTSYGAIAKYLSKAKASRMVGWAMNKAHQADAKVPAHRVVNRNGLLTGKNHFENINMMEQKLHQEGIKVENDKIINFDQHFWDPNIELL